jgi:hypothetical protein
MVRKASSTFNSVRADALNRAGSRDTTEPHLAHVQLQRQRRQLHRGRDRPGTVLVRDTKDNRRGPVLRLTPGDWKRFLAAVR